jgi:hypothetical protein
VSQPDLSTNPWPTTSSANSPSGVRSAIARAAGATGVDFSYLVAQARMESGMNPNARAATSSASGLYQFTNATWLQTLQKHGDMLGAGAMASDPAARQQMLALRSDPEASALMAASLASDNAQALTGALGRQPDSSELYLAHFLGPDGAGKFLAALSTNPDQSAAALLPKAASANASIFFDANGAPRSVGQMMGLIRSKMDNAMQAEGQAEGAVQGVGAADMAAYTAPAPTHPGGPIAQEWASAQAQMGAPAATSMADTLAAAFGGADGGASSDAVRSAYSRIRAFGL